MPIKIFGEIEERIKILVIEGYNPSYIEKQTGLNWGTIVSWCKKNNLLLGNYRTPELRSKEIRFIELIKSGSILKHACNEVDVDHSTGVLWAKRNGYSNIFRSRAEAAKDKQIPIEEAKIRLPQGHGEIVDYDGNGKIYLIQREDGTTYTRILSQLFRGDPKKSQKPRITEEEAAALLLPKGYRLIPGSFRIKREPVKAEHIVCGYVRENILANFNKQDCPRCSNTGTSKEETGLDIWVKSLDIESHKFRFKKDYPGKGKGKEIDIYVPSLKFGIEYCGFYRHGEKETLHSLNTKIEQHEAREENYEETKFDSPKWRHRAKMDKANDLGIKLITIFEHEWKNSSEKVKAVLKAKLSKNEIKIFARNTEIKEIDKNQSKEFLGLYHLQGNAPTLVRFGLFHNEDLVAVITGGHHHRVKNKFVLNRLCFKANTTVVGGSSKLNNALENWAKNNGYNEIISWSDNRWSDGGVYKALDYILEKEIDPDYFYFNGQGKMFSKQSCKKELLAAKGGIGNTEWEMAQSLKLDRIWDCGKKTWVKKLV